MLIRVELRVERLMITGLEEADENHIEDRAGGDGERRIVPAPLQHDGDDAGDKLREHRQMLQRRTGVHVARIAVNRKYRNRRRRQDASDVPPSGAVLPQRRLTR